MNHAIGQIDWIFLLLKERLSQIIIGFNIMLVLWIALTKESRISAAASYFFA